MTEKPRKRIVIVDDSPSYCDLWSNFILERYQNVANVETYSHPYDALPKIDQSIDLLIVDLEMPGMDGKKFVDYAHARGLSPRRMVTPKTLPAAGFARINRFEASVTRTGSGVELRIASS